VLVYLGSAEKVRNAVEARRKACMIKILVRDQFLNRPRYKRVPKVAIKKCRMKRNISNQGKNRAAKHFEQLFK